MEDDIANFRHRPTLKHSNNRAYYNLQVDKADTPIDAEVALSLIMEYLYYLGFKNQDELYDDVTTIAQRGVSECEKALFSVILSISVNPSFPAITMRLTFVVCKLP